MRQSLRLRLLHQWVAITERMEQLQQHLDLIREDLAEIKRHVKETRIAVDRINRNSGRDRSRP